jgi:hypothetical protein
MGPSGKRVLAVKAPMSVSPRRALAPRPGTVPVLSHPSAVVSLGLFLIVAALGRHCPNAR